MLSFTNYLIEANEEQQGKALKHLRHIEDYVIHGGHDGVGVADEHLRGMHDMLLGKILNYMLLQNTMERHLSYLVNIHKLVVFS